MSLADIQAMKALKMAKTNSMKTVPFVYNKDIGLKKWRSQIAALNAGAQNIINLNFIGDSITEGGLSGGGASSGNTPSSYLNNGYVGRVRSVLSSKFGDQGTGYISCYYPHSSPFWTFGSGWSQSSYGTTGYSMFTGTNGATASYTFTGTGFVLLSAQTSSAGSLSISIDGGSATVYNTNNATTNYCYPITITGLTNGSHTISITTQLSAGQYAWILGGYPLTNNTKGIRVNNCARWGTTTQDSGQTTSAVTAEIDYWAPKLTVIGLGANDFASQMSLTQYQSYLQTLITHAQSYGECILISLGMRSDVVNPAIPQSSYVQTMQNVALQNNCVYIDMWNRWGGSAAYSQSFLNFYGSGEKVHPNDYGHQDIATALLNVILEPSY